MDFFFLMIRRPPRSTLFPTRRSSDLMNLIRKEDSIRMGVSNVIGLTGLLGRWQCLSKQPYVVCDTGHNSGGWNYLAKQIARQAKNKRKIGRASCRERV